MTDSYPLRDDGRMREEYIKIPDHPTLFEKFCADWGVDELGSDRRGWDSDLSEYIRDSRYLIVDPETRRKYEYIIDPDEEALFDNYERLKLEQPRMFGRFLAPVLGYYPNAMWGNRLILFANSRLDAGWWMPHEEMVRIRLIFGAGKSEELTGTTHIKAYHLNMFAKAKEGCYDDEPTNLSGAQRG